MKYRKEVDPVCGVKIHLLACTEAELVVWGNRHGFEVELDGLENSLAMVFSKINEDDESMMWFRTDNDTECLSISVVAHEVFHLWHFMKAKMMGSRVLLLDVSNAEYDTYHFENLFRMVTEFAFCSFGDKISFPKTRRDKKKVRIQEKPVMVEEKV